MPYRYSSRLSLLRGLLWLYRRHLQATPLVSTGQDEATAWTAPAQNAEQDYCAEHSDRTPAERAQLALTRKHPTQGERPPWPPTQ